MHDSMPDGRRPVSGRPRQLWRPAFGSLFVAILTLVTVSELLLGLVVYGRLRSDLETDLGRRLVHVSQLLATGIDPALVLQFRAGDERLPAYDLTRARLRRQAQAAAVETAYVVDRDLRTLLDSRSETTLGDVRYGLLVNRAAVTSAAAGESTPTRLYHDEQGRLRLSALAPLRSREGAVVALVGVDASPEFFASLAALRRRMILLGGLSVGLAAIGSLLLLSQTGRRLDRLRQAVTRATLGDLSARAAFEGRHGRDEIGALGRDLDGLIGSIVATRDYYETVLASVDVAILSTDVTGEIRGANAAAQRLLAETGRDLVGRPLGEVVAREPQLARFVESVRTGGAQPASAEIPLRGGLAAGGLVLAASASRLREGGAGASGPAGGGLIVSLLDVTATREMERRARANERLAALGGMAGGLLHEVRNPLASMMLYLDLMKPAVPAGEGADLLERALVEGERLAAFLEDFQVFASLRPLRLSAVDLVETVEAAAASLAWPVSVRQVWARRDPASLRADRRLLEHAVRNLLRNAVEALSASGGLVTLAVERDAEGLLVRVSDDGPGIAPEVLERVLDPLFTTKSQGIGMGLSIVQRVVEAHGGSLQMTSADGRGAAFTLRLPPARGG